MRLHRPRLRGNRRAGSEVRTRATEQDGSRDRDHHRHLHLLLLAEHARDVPLGDVRDFVGQHRSQLRLGLGGGDQPGVHADETARHGEGVDRGVADGEELEILPGAHRDLGQAVAQRRQVFADLGVIDVGRLAEADVAHHGFAEAALHLRRKRRVARAAEIRQRLAEAARRGHREDRCSEAG